MVISSYMLVIGRLGLGNEEQQRLLEAAREAWERQRMGAEEREEREVRANRRLDCGCLGRSSEILFIDDIYNYMIDNKDIYIYYDR